MDGWTEITGETIHWRLQHEEDPRPEASVFLNRDELLQLDQLTVASRRRDWLLGRHTAKTLIRDTLHQSDDLDVPLPEVSIVAGADGAPSALAGEKRLSLSISHRAGWSLCAMTRKPDLPVGADVELVETRSPRFVQDFFTENERRQVRAAGAAADEIVTALWSAKEAALKALHLGLTVDTRRAGCDLSPPATSWSPFVVRYTAEGSEGSAGPSTLHGCWRRRDQLVLTLALASGRVSRGRAPPSGATENTRGPMVH